jgi:hypothetical protein
MRSARANWKRDDKENNFMRRGFRRAFRRAPAPDIPPLLQRANALMTSGDYEGAAAAFEQLAAAAEERGGPRAPRFFLDTGRARILAGQTAAGMSHLKHGLELFAVRGELLYLHRAGQRLLAELNQRGLSAEAKEIEAMLTSRLPANFTPPAARKPLLPSHCPSCGGALRADEVEWLDEATAECAYCGSPVRGE